MKITWDFSELVEFGKNITNQERLETTLMTATQSIARVLQQHILNRTPIDTGNLRKMWSAGDNLRFTVNKVNNGYEVTLINMARNERGELYGVWVNDGHSTPSGNGWVMGKFFVENSILATEQSAEDIVARELQKWWKVC
jgi:hypothetical protein